MSRWISGVMEVRGTLLKEMVGVGGGVDGELECCVNSGWYV